MKTLRRRYLAVSMDSHDTVDSREFMDTIWDAVTKLFGEYGASQAGLSLIDYDETKKLVVIRTWNKTLEMVRTAIASITRIDGKPMTLHVLAVSGTLKALSKRLEESQVPN